MTKDATFDERLARIEALRGQRPPQVDLIDNGPAPLGSARRNRPNLGMISATAGFALIAGMIGWNWDSLAPLLPSEHESVQMTFLETSVYDSMTEDEISRMNSDPDLKDKSVMQKLLLSN